MYVICINIQYMPRIVIDHLSHIVDVYDLVTHCRCGNRMTIDIQDMINVLGDLPIKGVGKHIVCCHCHETVEGAQIVIKPNPHIGFMKREE